MSVPVLSITTVVIRAEASSAVAFLNSTPRRAPSPVPTMIAVGVARPSASGQVTTTTVIANSSAIVNGSSENSAHAAKVAAPPSRATKTSQNAARSASRCPGALEFCACCTSETIWARALSAPTFVARTRSVPSALMVAPMTSLPGVLCTGRLSPVTIDSSTSDSPSSTTPVDRDLRAGPDEQQVIGDDLGGGHLDLVPVAEHDGPGWGEVEQRPDGVVGAASGAHLEPVPEQHERGQHGRGLVEHLAAAGQGDHQ